MTSTSIREAESQLSRLVERALSGEEVIIAEAGRPLVRLVPVSTGVPDRVGGQWRGRVRMADDFDELPDEIATAFGLEPR